MCEPPLVKICGLREIVHIDAAVASGADFVGVIFAESPRRVSLEQARAIRARLGPRIPILDAEASAVTAARRAVGRPLLVGVFADQAPETINRIAVGADLDLVQLSGGEHPALIGRLNRPVLRVLHVGPEDSSERLLAEARRLPPTITLLDTQDAARRGGSGRSFDWSIAAAVAAQRPLMLAGGLGPENVAAAVAQVRPWAVDVSSGVERAGRKDPAEIAAFIQAAVRAPAAIRDPS